MVLDRRNSSRANILGVGVSPINIPIALETIRTWIEQDQHHYICVTGVHGIIESQRDRKLRQIHNAAGLVTPDGMPLVWLSRAQGFKEVGRVYGPDLMLALCEYSQAYGYRHFLYGSTNEVLECLCENLKNRFPKLTIVGTHAPPFRPLAESEIHEEIDKINGTQPDIVWVGLSTPKQERWMDKNIRFLSAKVIIGVGAAFDFHAGLKKQAPPWMQRNGMEWFFRLITEPRRLWKRYLINNPTFLFLVAGQMLGIKKYSLE
jgi:N-acetylglucosaminyldiphosphoundecaprenol N-acetyl-beta-D-mannosaminyltransferase